MQTTDQSDPGTFVLAMSHIVVDSGLYDALANRFMEGFVTFRRLVLPSGDIVYALAQEQLGELGTLTVRPLTGERCEIQAGCPAIRNEKQREHFNTVATRCLAYLHEGEQLARMARGIP